MAEHVDDLAEDIICSLGGKCKYFVALSVTIYDSRDVTCRTVCCLYHHHRISVMELGHLLTRSGLTYPEVSSKVCHDSLLSLLDILMTTFSYWKSCYKWALCKKKQVLMIPPPTFCMPCKWT
jgi:hypothetical protein